MNADIVTFKPAHRQPDPWDAYFWAFQKVQSEYPRLTIESMRARVEAHDRLVEHITRFPASSKPHQRTPEHRGGESHT